MSTIRNSNYILVTHFLIYSASQALRDYLVEKKVASLCYISHPLPQIDANKKEHSYASYFAYGKELVTRKDPTNFRGLLLPVLSHFILTLLWSFQLKSKADLFIGIDNVNAFAGLVLKRFGRVKKVVYYTIDYFPTRYENKFLNGLYHWLDKFCVRYSDETWNVSSKMVNARKLHNTMLGVPYSRQFTVPIGIWFDRSARRGYDPIRRFRLVFVGHLVKHMGVDLVIRSMKELIRRYPSIELDIIGGGEELESLKHLAKRQGVFGKIQFHGWVKDRKKVEKLIADCGIGLATFNTTILDEKVNNADPAKIKDYMLLGLPVVVTKAISNWRKLESQRCAIIAGYSEQEFVSAVTTLLDNESVYREYRENALQYIRQFDYEALFQKNLQRIIST